MGSLSNLRCHCRVHTDVCVQCAPPIKNGFCYMHWKGCDEPTQTFYHIPGPVLKPTGALQAHNSTSKIMLTPFLISSASTRANPSVPGLTRR